MSRSATPDFAQSARYSKAPKNDANGAHLRCAPHPCRETPPNMIGLGTRAISAQTGVASRLVRSREGTASEAVGADRNVPRSPAEMSRLWSRRRGRRVAVSAPPSQMCGTAPSDDFRSPGEGSPESRGTFIPENGGVCTGERGARLNAHVPRCFRGRTLPRLREGAASGTFIDICGTPPPSCRRTSIATRPPIQHSKERGDPRSRSVGAKVPSDARAHAFPACPDSPTPLALSPPGSFSSLVPSRSTHPRAP